MAENILFCPIYDKTLNKMMLNMVIAMWDNEKLEILTDFAAKFTLLPEQLSELYRLSGNCNKNVEIDKYSRLYSHYYGGRKDDKNIYWSDKGSILEKLKDYTCKNRFEIADVAMTFPHQHLEGIHEIRLFYSFSPISKTMDNRYAKSFKIYNKLKKSENEIDKWLDCIKEIDNREAVIANLELKLGQNLNWKNKKLWKFYFEFLRENNLKEILEVFRKYTRLFISDKQAVADYRNELNKCSTLEQPQIKYWIDTIKYEMDFGKLEVAYCILERALKAVIGKEYNFVVKNEKDLWGKLRTFEREIIQHEKLQESSKISNVRIQEATVSLLPVTDFQNPKVQKFCFRQTFIRYLLNSADISVLKKLYSTCKFLYSLKAAPLCFRLEISSEKKTSYCTESIYVNEKDIDFTGLDNLHIYGILNAGNCSSRNLVSKLIPKIKYFNPTHIYLQEQDLTLAEFKKLLSKCLLQVTSLHVNINDNGKNINVKSFNDIVDVCPAIKYIDYATPKHLTCRIFGHSDSSKKRFRKWLHSFDRTKLEALYFENQIFLVSDLSKFINYGFLKEIKLKNVLVKNENGLQLDQQELEAFIKASVNPENYVCVEIL